MSTVLVVTADLQGDPTDLIKAFNAAVKASEEFSDQSEQDSKKANAAWDSMKSGLAKVGGAIALYFSAQAISDFVNEAIVQAGNLEQSAGAVDAVFKTSADQVHAWAAESANAVGLSTDAYNTVASVIGTQLKTAGYSLDDAAKKTNDLIGTAADLASMFGGTTADAVDSLSAAFRGEYDSIEKYGMSIKESDIQARLAEKGLKDLTGEAYRNARAQELLAIISQQSADSAGNFARESDTLQGQQQRLRAEFENQQAALGQELLPAMNSLVQVARDVLPPVMTFLQQTVRAVADGLGDMSQWVQENQTLLGFLATVVGGGAVAWTAYTVAVNAATIAGNIASTATKVWTAVQAAFNVVMNANPIMLVITLIGMLVAAIIWVATQTTFFQDAWAAVSEWFVGVWTAVSSFFKGIWESIVSWWTGLVNSVTSWFESTWQAIADTFTTIWTNVASFFTDIWNGIVSFLTPVFEFIAGIVRTYIEIWYNIFLVFAAVLVTVWRFISDVVTTVWNAIVAFLTPIITAIVDFVVTTFTNMVNFWVGVWTAISDFFTGIWNGIVDFLTPIVVTIASFLLSTFNSVASWWNTTWQGISDFFTGIWNAIVGFVVPIVYNIYSTITSVIGAVSSWWNSTWSSISSFFTSIWDGMVNGVRTAVDWISSTISGIYDTVMGVFSNVGSWLVSTGEDLIRGFWNGISGMWDWITSQIGGFFSGIVDWAKDTLGIHSPSTVMMEVGYYTGEGVAVGVKNAAKLVEDASVYLIPKVPDPKSLTATWDAATGSGTYGIPPWASSSSAAGGAQNTWVINLKVDGAQVDDVDTLADLVADKLQFALDAPGDPTE